MGFQILKGLDFIHLSQQKYVVDLLIRNGMDTSKSAKTPMSVGISLSLFDEELLESVAQF